MLVLGLAGAATAQDNLKIMNPDAGIFPYDLARVGLSLMREHHAPRERQSLKISATQPGYAGVHRPGVSAVCAWGNWQDYDRLQFWVKNANEKKVEMQVTVKSALDGKKGNAMKYFKLDPGEQVVTLKLADFLSNDKVRPNLTEVTQWVLGFDEPFEQPLYFGSISLVRCTKRVLNDPGKDDWKGPKDLLLENVTGDVRLKCTFPAGQTARAWWAIPRAKTMPFQVPEPRSVWRGYEKLAVDFVNPAQEPQKATVYVADLTADFMKDKPAYEKQLARAEVTIPPGKNTLEIPLADLRE